MANQDTTSTEKLKARYPEGAFNPHLDQTGTMARYNKGGERRFDNISTGGKIVGRGRSKAKRVSN